MRPRPIIAFHSELAKELGGVAEAIYYQQMWYWSDKGNRKDGFIYKTKEEIQNETTLTRFQQDRVRKYLVNKGWLEIKKEKVNGAPTLLYLPKISVDVVIGKVSFLPMEKQVSRVSTISEITTESSDSLLKEKNSNSPSMWRIPQDENESYQEPMIDSETNEVINPCPEPDKIPIDARKGYESMLHWAEKQRNGLKFTDRPTQYKALKKAKSIGLTSIDLKERWLEMENNKFWEEKGFNWIHVVSSFNMKGK